MQETDKTEEKVPDLEQLRDEKCIPIARTIMKEMPEYLLTETGTEDKSHQVLALKALSLMLETDLNINLEASYVPQLILGGLTGLNRTVYECDLEDVDEARYKDIAIRILTVLAESDIRLTNVTPEESAADFLPVKEKINEIFKEEHVTRLDVKYIMDNILESFTSVNNMLSRSIEDSTAKASAKLFGVPDITDLTMKKLDEVLKA